MWTLIFEICFPLSLISHSIQYKLLHSWNLIRERWHLYFPCFIRITSPFSYSNRNSSWNVIFLSWPKNSNLAGLVYLSDSITWNYAILKLWPHYISLSSLCKRNCIIFSYFGKFRMFCHYVCCTVRRAYVCLLRCDIVISIVRSSFYIFVLATSLSNSNTCLATWVLWWPEKSHHGCTNVTWMKCTQPY